MPPDIASLHTPPRHWLEEVQRFLHSGQSCVRITLLATRGSVPREAGTSMVVGLQESLGTIGGGRLEFLAMERAHALLREGILDHDVAEWTLGRDFQQCCGGWVRIRWERYTPHGLEDVQSLLDRLRRGEHVVLLDDVQQRVGDTHPGIHHANHPHGNLHNTPPGDLNNTPPGDLHNTPPGDLHRGLHSHVAREPAGEILRLDRQPLWLFGAGHVGQALVRILQDLPIEITWIDTRASWLPPSHPPSWTSHCVPVPEAQVSHAPPSAWFLVMTHDHAQDLRIVDAILRLREPRFLGLIGSRAKARRFRKHLLREGHPEERLSHLVCPIGVHPTDTRSTDTRSTDTRLAEPATPSLYTSTRKWPMAIAIATAQQLLHLV
jgi:xanthine dehydrogenase accessory factor